MVKLCGVPGQLTEPLVKVGVTVIVAVTGELVLLVAVKDEILPFPDAGIPIEGAELVHV